MRKDRDGLVVSYDDATAQMLGWQPDAMAGHDLLETAHPDDHQRAMEAWDDLLGHPGQARRVRLRLGRPRGGWVWVETTDHNLLDDPEHGIVLAELVDVTDEMAAVDALHASEEVMRRLTDALPVGAFQLAADGRVVYRNGRVSGAPRGGRRRRRLRARPPGTRRRRSRSSRSRRSCATATTPRSSSAASRSSAGRAACTRSCARCAARTARSAARSRA